MKTKAELFEELVRKYKAAETGLMYEWSVDFDGDKAKIEADVAKLRKEYEEAPA